MDARERVDSFLKAYDMYDELIAAGWTPPQDDTATNAVNISHMDGLCKCSGELKVHEIGYYSKVPLEGGGHTEFIVLRCNGCRGVLFFPDTNGIIALRDGTPETKAKLAEIIAG